ncbi:MAG: hypothetical protein NC120_08105 [Ruminococcus sp.]|nr:hypothetical protein [Ruminococcus sp.]
MKKMYHLKKPLITVLLLIISTLLSNCQNDENINRKTVEKNSETVTSSITTSEAPVIEIVTYISDTSTDIKTENSDTAFGDTSESGAEYGEYIYSPPTAALDLDFCRDKIIHKIEYTYYLNDSPAGLPEYILSDMNYYAKKVIEEDDILGKGSFVLERIGVDMFDINSDGFDDYIVVGEIIDIEGELNFFPYTIEKLYIKDGNDGFNAIDFPASCGKGSTLYDNILSTKTNGFNDFMGFCYYDIILISFDGNSTYSETEILDEDYTWEYLDNGLVKISVYENNHGNEHKNEIAVAKFIYDTDYTEHILLYSSLPDGTPSSSVIGKNGYKNGHDVFEFYVILILFKHLDKSNKK